MQLTLWLALIAVVVLAIALLLRRNAKRQRQGATPHRQCRHVVHDDGGYGIITLRRDVASTSSPPDSTLPK